MAAHSRVREPIVPDKPAGEDLTFAPEFEAIAKEIAKLEAIEGRPDWKKIEREADQLLLERTKDLRLVVWSTVAKVNLRTWDGLADGLSLYLDVLPFWDHLFPPAKRAKGRANLHDWFIQQSVGVLEMLEVGRDNEPALLTAQATLQEVDGLLEERLGDAYLGSSRLRSVLRRKLEELPPASVAPLSEPAPEPAPAPPELEPPPVALAEPQPEVRQAEPEPEPAPRSAEVPVVSSPASEPPRPREPERPVLVYAPTSSAGAAEAVDASLDALLVASKLLLEEDPADARAFRLRRVVAALRFDPSSPLDPPSEDLRQRLAGCFERGELAVLIEEAEVATFERPAWLDAYRYLVEALGRSGGAWMAAHSTVREELLAFLARAPSMLGRKFSDGSPVAEPATLEWLEREQRRVGGARSILEAEDRDMERRFAQVRELASDGRLNEAVMLATALANRAADVRGRFQGFVLAGTTALAAGKPAIARPLLGGLLELVERHQLETWEPSLCVTLYGALLTCLRALGGGSESSREQDLFDRLCRLDPAAAMRLGDPS